MDDLISRQAAIETITRHYQAYEDLLEVIAYEDLLDVIAYEIEHLPSAQHEKRTEERTKTHACDCIDRQAAIDRINKQREHLQPDIYPQDKVGDAAYRICAEFIERLPSAQPEIIACGDCKHWICHDRRCGYWNHGVKPLDWCCHAERRTDGD